MNKWLLLFTLSFCFSIRSSEYKVHVDVKQNIGTVVRKIDLRSLHADLIAIAEDADLEIAFTFISDELFSNVRYSPDRQLLFIKILIELISRRPEAYTAAHIHGRIEKRIRDSKEAGEGISYCKQIDRALMFTPIKLPEGFNRIISPLILDYIALFTIQSFSRELDFSKTRNSNGVLIVLSESISRLPKLCHEIIRVCLIKLYDHYNSEAPFDRMQTYMQDLQDKLARKLRFIETADIYASSSALASQTKKELESILDPLSDHELVAIYCMLNAPFLHSSIAQSVLIKCCMYMQKAGPRVRKDRSFFMKNIAERLIEQKDPEKSYAVHFRKNLHCFLGQLEGFLAGFDDKEYKPKVDLKPDMKILIKALINWYEQMGWYKKKEKHLKSSSQQEDSSSVPQVDTSWLHEIVTAEADSGSLEDQIRDISQTMNQDAIDSLFGTVIKELHVQERLKQALTKEVQVAEEQVKKDYEDRKSVQDAIAKLEADQKLLQRRLEVIGSTSEQAALAESIVAQHKKELEAQRLAITEKSGSELLSIRQRLIEELERTKALEAEKEELRKQVEALKKRAAIGDIVPLAPKKKAAAKKR